MDYVTGWFVSLTHPPMHAELTILFSGWLAILPRYFDLFDLV